MARPFRHTFILVLFAAVTTLAAVGGWRYARASAPVSGPIILISIDALRADHLPIYGYTGVKTPALDALGADGVVFERAYAHVPQSLPSYASLLSGRLPFETGVRDEAGFAVKDNERMLAEILRDRGFATAAIVSSFSLRKETGIGQGFELYDDRLPAAVDGVEPVERDGEIAERAAEKWLDDGHATRSFLFLQLAEPHKPYAPPPAFADYSPYDGEIARADQIVGRLVRYLKTHQLYDQSTIIVVSDHGEGLGDHGEQSHGLFVYEEAVRVPLLVKPAAGDGSGREQSGRRISDLAQLIDVAPTILDLAKAPIPGNLRGRSLKSFLDGGGSLPERTIYSESFYGRYHLDWKGLTSLTDGRYRYIHGARPELYDRESDPAERENLVDLQPETAARFRSRLDDMLQGSAIVAPTDLTPDARERLALLGYVNANIESVGPDPGGIAAILESHRTAVDFDRTGEWPDAIAHIETLLQADPEAPDLWLRLARVAARAGRHERSIEAFERALTLRPDDAASHLGLASELVVARQVEEARAHAEQAAAPASSDAQIRAAAHEVLMRIALGAHDSVGALAEAEAATESDPARPLSDYVVGRLLLDQRRYEAALSRFEKALEDFNRTHGRPIADLHSSAAQALVRLERFDEAEYYFEEELRAFPSSIRVRADLATLYYSTGRLDEAARVLDDLVRITSTPDAYLLASRTWASFGDPQRAADLRARARKF